MGPSIVGFGSYSLTYADGRESDWPLVAFSPRKQNLVLYVKRGFDGEAALIKRLGRLKASKGCLYLGPLENIDLAALEEIVTRSVKMMKARYPAAKK